MSPLFQRIIEDKERRRRVLAALPYPEKVKIVEQLRKTALQIRTATDTNSKPSKG